MSAIAFVHSLLEAGRVRVATRVEPPRATAKAAPVRTEIDGHMWGLSRRSFQVA